MAQTVVCMRKKRNKIKQCASLWRVLAVAAIAVFATPGHLFADEISDVFDQLLSTPDDPALNLRYAELAMAKGETRKALAAYERVLAHDPDNAEVRRAYKKAKRQLQPAVTAFTLNNRPYIRIQPAPGVQQLR